MTKFIKPLRGGQITIPIEFRQKLGIGADSLLQINLDKGELRITPVNAAKTVGGSPWLKELYDIFAPVRKQIKEGGYTEQEVNEAIDAAVKAVRKNHA